MKKVKIYFAGKKYDAGRNTHTGYYRKVEDDSFFCWEDDLAGLPMSSYTVRFYNPI